jgi:hypothetical protein
MSIEAYDYGKKDGTAEELARIVKVLEELERQYYDAKPTSEIGLHPLRVAIRKIQEKTNEL